MGKLWKDFAPPSRKGFSAFHASSATGRPENSSCRVCIVNYLLDQLVVVELELVGELVVLGDVAGPVVDDAAFLVLVPGGAVSGEGGSLELLLDAGVELVDDVLLHVEGCLRVLAQVSNGLGDVAVLCLEHGHNGVVVEVGVRAVEHEEVREAVHGHAQVCLRGVTPALAQVDRSEERRVGKERITRTTQNESKINKTNKVVE